MSPYLFPPPAVASLPIRGRSERFPVQRIFCVGRNYHAHAAEMGKSVDKATEQPFYFTKSPLSLVSSGATIPYPPQTSNFHYEMELVLAVGTAGFRLSAESAHEVIFGYAAGLDMTRRDLQQNARENGRPWDLGKDIENGAVCGEITPLEGIVIEHGAIVLSVNGQNRQVSDVSQLIWGVREIVSDLSLFYHLRPGDLIYTGTPEGVGPLVPGDRLLGHVEGVGDVALAIGSAE